MRGNVIAAIPDRNDALLNWFDITKRTCVRERTHRTYALNLMDSAAVPTPGVDTLMVHFRPNKPAIIYTRAS
jgi:hypothetical protein